MSDEAEFDLESGEPLADAIAERAVAFCRVAVVASRLEPESEIRKECLSMLKSIRLSFKTVPVGGDNVRAFEGGKQ